MTVMWVMIIGCAEELFVSAAAKVRNSATQINANGRRSLGRWGQRERFPIFLCTWTPKAGVKINLERAVPHAQNIEGRGPTL